MVDELRGMGIELMITFWPFMGLPYPNGTAVATHWDEFNSKGCVCVCVCVLSHWVHAALVKVSDLPSLKCSSH